MSRDTIGFPLPRFVKGFACLTPGDVELASKGTDPAHPKAAADPRQERAQPQQSVTLDPQRLDSAREAAQAQAARVVSYTPGAPRTGAIDTGTVFSVRA